LEDVVYDGNGQIKDGVIVRAVQAEVLVDRDVVFAAGIAAVVAWVLAIAD